MVFFGIKITKCLNIQKCHTMKNLRSEHVDFGQYQIDVNQIETENKK